MKTAIEWLIEQLENHNGVTRAGFEKCIQQAKEMEKKQIKDAYEKGKKYKKPIKDSNPIWLNSKPYKKK